MKYTTISEEQKLAIIIALNDNDIHTVKIEPNYYYCNRKKGDEYDSKGNSIYVAITKWYKSGSMYTITGDILRDEAIDFMKKITNIKQDNDVEMLKKRYASVFN